MQHNKTHFFQPLTLSQQTPELTELRSSENSSPVWLNDSTLTSPGLLYLPLIAAVTGWLLLFFVLHLNLWKLLRQRMTPIQQNQQSTCYQCKFFSHNAYMKCAVNPSIVLKTEANNCVDYFPKDKQE